SVPLPLFSAFATVAFLSALALLSALPLLSPFATSSLRASFFGAPGMSFFCVLSAATGGNAFVGSSPSALAFAAAAFASASDFAPDANPTAGGDPLASASVFAPGTGPPTGGDPFASAAGLTPGTDPATGGGVAARLSAGGGVSTMLAAAGGGISAMPTAAGGGCTIGTAAGSSLPGPTSNTSCSRTCLSVRAPA